MKAETLAALQDARTKRARRDARHPPQRCRRGAGLSRRRRGRARRAMPRSLRPRSAPWRSASSETVDVGGAKIFLNVYVPPLRLIVVGAVHIAQALAPMAAMLDFDVTVVDPRGAWATDAALSRREGDPGLGRRGVPGAGPDVSHRRRDPDARSQARRSGARSGAEVRCLLHRRAGQPADPCQAQGAAGRGRHHRRDVRPHPRAGRPQHRRQVAGRDRGVDPRPDRRGAGAPPRSPGRPKVVAA